MQKTISILGVDEPAWAAQDQNPWHETEEGELGVDVYETENTVVVRTAVAGVAPGALSISLTNDLLTIRGIRKAEDEATEDRQYLLRECHWGPFSRSLILPSVVSFDGSGATFKNGILTIVLPKVSKGSEIPILNLDIDSDE